MTAESIPPGAVIRISPASFAPARLSEIQEMTDEVSRFLIPAIKKLPGLIAYYAATSPGGSQVHVSIWESDEHAQQMSRLKEMIVDARQAAEKVGATFDQPIVNYQIDWTV